MEIEQKERWHHVHYDIDLDYPEFMYNLGDVCMVAASYAAPIEKCKGEDTLLQPYGEPPPPSRRLGFS